MSKFANIHRRLALLSLCAAYAACGSESTAADAVEVPSTAQPAPEDQALPDAIAEPTPAVSEAPELASKGWSIFRGDTGLTGRSSETLPTDPSLLWTFETGGAITSSPTIADGRVYIGSDDAMLHCLDIASGEEIWASETQDMIEAPPLVLDGRVFIGSSDYFFYAFDAITGEELWKYETDDKILGGANYIQGDDGTVIVVGSYDTKLYGFDPASGDKLWEYATDNYINGTPAISEGLAVFGGCDAVLHQVDTRTGEQYKSVPLCPDCHIAGSVAIADGYVYFGHYGNQFVCIEMATGNVRWSYGSGRQAFFSSPAIGDERVIFGGRDRHLHCVDKVTGEAQWSFATRRKVDGSPVLCGDRVVFGSGDGRLYILDATTGEETWSYEIGQSLISSPAVFEKRIYIGGLDGSLYVFGESGS
ncbi:MAG: outer membrane protein assembly factor BamB [Planctomycetota bacterium]|jgi:outer membrane protein assembly factor BamB